jgi:hypothetical protein
MKSKRFMVLCAVLALALLASVAALAMSSLSYQLNWFVPLSGGGGGRSSSPSYTADFTVGQTVARSSASASYQAGLGYWYGIENRFILFLPALQKGD